GVRKGGGGGAGRGGWGGSGGSRAWTSSMLSRATTRGGASGLPRRSSTSARVSSAPQRSMPSSARFPTRRSRDCGQLSHLRGRERRWQRSNLRGRESRCERGRTGNLRFVSTVRSARCATYEKLKRSARHDADRAASLIPQVRMRDHRDPFV